MIRSSVFLSVKSKLLSYRVTSGFSLLIMVENRIQIFLSRFNWVTSDFNLILIRIECKFSLNSFQLDLERFYLIAE